MASPSLKFASAALLLLLLSPMLHSEFSLRSLTVFANVNLDGSVNVEERIEMEMKGTVSKELYEATRSAYTDLATWKARTGLTEMRHHVTRVAADVKDLRVTPQRIDYCNSILGTCYATVVIDYIVPAGKEGSGLVKVDRYKPRTAKYSLIPEALSFEHTKTGDLVLPSGTLISIAVPQAAEKIYFSSPPQTVDASEGNFRYDQSSNVRYYVGRDRLFTWKGDSLSRFSFTYEIESPLESEVLDFFRSSQGRLVEFFFGPQGLAAILILAAAGVSIYQFNRLKL
ncbi:MAG: hypothetical protein QW568_00565 [Candidatus Anstonellaceae archaeon]